MEPFSAAALALLGLAAMTVLTYSFYALYIRSLPQRRKLNCIPGPPGLPVFGNLFDLFYNPMHQQIAKWVEEYGPIYKMSFVGLKAVVLTDPEAVTAVLKVEQFDKSDKFYIAIGKLTTYDDPNILSSVTDLYNRALRKAIAPAFSTANLKKFFPEVVELTRRLIRHMEAHGSVVPMDIDNASQRFTMDVIGRFGFGTDFGALEFGRNEVLGVIQDLMVALQRASNPLNQWFRWRKIPIYSFHRSTAVWGPDADQFKPERWLVRQQPQGQQDRTCNGNNGNKGGMTEEQDEFVRSAGTTAACGWIPFSDGSRSCVGQPLAMMELRTVLVMMCGRFRFKLSEDMAGVAGVMKEATQDITLHPGPKGLMMHVIPRV